MRGCICPAVFAYPFSPYFEIDPNPFPNPIPNPFPNPMPNPIPIQDAWMEC